MKSLRVCHVIHDTNLGGTEMMLLKIVSRLSTQHEMCVLSLLKLGEIGERIQRLGVPVHAMEFVANRIVRPDRVVGLANRLRQFKPDVVQTWAYHADLCGGVAARLSTKAAILWNVRHATLDPKIDSRNVMRSAQLCGKLSAWVPDRILLNAQAAVDVHAAAGYDRQKMQVIANGFDTQRFRRSVAERHAIRKELGIPNDVFVMGMCGRFHPHKGQSQFVRVAKRLVQRYPTSRFIMAGEGSDTRNIELSGWLKDAGLSKHFHLVGARPDVPALLNAMDVYLLPSITEGMPNAVGEAMACELPVVSSDVGDARRLVGDCGSLVPPNDVSAMSAAVETQLEMPLDERLDLGRRARNRIRADYTIDCVATQYDTAWRQAREQRSSGRRTFVQPAAFPALIQAKDNSPIRRFAGNFSHRTKLVHVTTIPLTQWLFLNGQNDYMRGHGFDVHSVSSPGTYLETLRERDPVTTHAIPMTRRITPGQDFLSVFRLFRLFQELRPEIVQLSTPKAALLGAVAAKAAGVPVRIYQVRGLSSESESGIRRLVFQRFERITARLCNGCFVNAPSLLDYARQARILRAGVVAGRGMSNGVDLAQFDPSTTRRNDMLQWDARWDSQVGPVIGFVGRLTRDKGLEDLYVAWKSLREEFKTARLLLVGPWESENAVSPACREGLTGDPRVVVTGMQSVTAGFYKNMDVLAFPSHGTEGFPNVPMEAAAMGLPVVSTRVVGCLDAVVHDVTGCLVEPRNASELEAALCRYLKSPTLRAQHGTAGRRRVHDGFRPEDLWAEFRDYYLHLLRREGLRCPTQDDSVALPKAA